MNPYCFVITSFDKKDSLKDLQEIVKSGKTGKPVKQIYFEKIYKDLIKPAILLAELEPLIENEESAGGVIHKTMYEKIIMCEYSVVDLTNANPNVYFEIGMRYAVRPYTTIPIAASSQFPLPFDVINNRTLPYQVDNDFNLMDKEKDIKKLADKLITAKKKKSTDSPLYDLVSGIAFQNSVAHEKTDVFREKVLYDKKIKEELAYARNLSDGSDDKVKIKSMRLEAINKIVLENGKFENVETGVLIDMMLSYRNIEAFDEMMNFIKKLPRYVFKTVLVQEQYAFVLNRNGGKKKLVDNVMIQEAEDTLKNLEKNGKASSETYGIWGRIYKDKFDRAYNSGDKGEAKVFLKSTLKYYEKGFESDPRDAYPGVNYVTCLELLGKKEKALRMVPAVEYSVRAKMKRKDPDYWDYATLLELAVIENKFDEAEGFFYEAKPLAVESWMFETTKGNLEKIINYRKERKEKTAPIKNILKMFG